MTSRRLQMPTNGADFGIVLEQYDSRSDELVLHIGGDAIVDGDGGASMYGDGVTFTVCDPHAIRALGEALVVLAARAEDAGMLKAMRERQERDATLEKERDATFAREQLRRARLAAGMTQE